MATSHAHTGKEMTEPEWLFLVDEHDVKDPETGNIAFRVTADDLRKAAENGNKRIEESGDYTPITLGHTKEDAPEGEQPPIVGLAGPFRVEPFFGTGRMGIKGAMRYFKDKAHLAKEYPRRSVEVTWADHLIDPVAILGATTPARNLGMAYSRRKGACISCKRRYCSCDDKHLYTSADSPREMAIKDELLAELKQTATWKEIEQLARERQGEQEAREAAHEKPEEQPTPEPPPTPEAPPSTEMAQYAHEDEDDQTVDLAMIPGQESPPETELEQQESPMPATASPSATNVAPAAPMGEQMPDQQGMPPELRDEHMKQAKYWYKLAGQHMEGGNQDAYKHCLSYSHHHMKYAKTASGTGDQLGDRLENDPKVAEPPPDHGPGVDHMAESLEGEEGGMPGAETELERGKHKMSHPSRQAADETEKIRMQRDQAIGQLRRLQADVDALKASDRETKMRLRLANRERDFVQLENDEGLFFDRAEELEYVKDMDDDQYGKHLKMMKTRYARAPVGGPHITPASNAHMPPPSHKPASPAQGDRNLAERAVELSGRSGISYAEARKQLAETNGAGQKTL